MGLALYLLGVAGLLAVFDECCDPKECNPWVLVAIAVFWPIAAIVVVIEMVVRLIRRRR